MLQIDKALVRIEKLGGRVLVRRMIGAFLENSTSRVDAARKALAVQDFEALQRATHSLKSSAVNVGAAHLRELASEIEQRSIAGYDGGEAQTRETLIGLVVRLPEALDEVRTHLSGVIENDKNHSGR